VTDDELREKRETADARLWSAIVEHADAYMLSEDGEMLSQFAVIAQWEGEVADEHSRYTTHFHSPIIPTHVAEGLFWHALNLNMEDAE
jgi:hypothetical protein